MGILFGFLAALVYGTGDFVSGLGSRRIGARLVTPVVQFCSLIAAIFSVFLFPGVGPTKNALIWGGVSGIGSAVGTYALYRGLEVGQMSVVASLSALLTAVFSAVVGLLLGEHLSDMAAIGVCIAVPAIALVSWQPNPNNSRNFRAGIKEGVLSGMSFAFLFIALNQAGIRSGAWPLVPGQGVSLILLVPFAWGARRRLQSWDSSTALVITAGLLTGIANLLFLAAVGHAQLSIIAVLTSLYPAMTIILARIFLKETWSTFQTLGLVIAAIAVTLIVAG